MNKLYLYRKILEKIFYYLRYQASYFSICYFRLMKPTDYLKIAEKVLPRVSLHSTFSLTFHKISSYSVSSDCCLPRTFVLSPFRSVVASDYLLTIFPMKFDKFSIDFYFSIPTISLNKFIIKMFCKRLFIELYTIFIFHAINSFLFT